MHLTLPDNTIINPPPATTRLLNAPPSWKVWSTMQDATHPPLYFLALRLWRNLTGESDLASRLLSVLCSLAAIAFLYDTTTRLHGHTAAIWAAIIMAIASPQIEYAQATRNYAFLLMTSLAACSALTRIEINGPRIIYLLWLTAALLATALTHYFSIGALLALFAYAALRFRGPARWKTLATFFAAGLFFLILWLPHLRAHLHTFSVPERTTEFLYDPHPGHILRTLKTLATLPMMLLINLPSNSPVWTAIGALIFILILSPLGRRTDLLLWWLWLAGVIGSLAALDLLRNTQQLPFTRYTLLAGPALYALIAAVPARWGKLTPHLIPAAIALVCAIALPHVYERNRPDFQDLAKLLDQAGPNDLLIFAAPAKRQTAPAELFLGYSHYSNPLHRSPILLMTDTLPPQVTAQFQNFQHIWLINASPEILPTQILPNYAALGPAQTRFPATIWQILPKPQATTRPAAKP
ncbi:MAG TPA: glycosyltransferase family 39 protein [Tepidisphaeraceae bacterium]|nr:glycosyltransferase family 39 protein [Tepidisphaeraceae bacterium]